MEELQSWWQVPTIAHFCSLFRAAFNLLDFDIEELEEALIQENNEEYEQSFLEELVVRLLGGCYQRNNLNVDNYHKFLRDFVKHRCSEELSNILNEKSNFLGLSVRHKVDMLHSLCDARLDAHDVAEVLKNLEADSLRVEPLGEDAEGRIYWYFYGTRLYREEKEKVHDKKPKEKKRRRGKQKLEDSENGKDVIVDATSKWSIICSTEEEWRQLAEGFKKSKIKCEKELHQSLTVHFLPEISRMIGEKEKIVKKRLTELLPRRSSRRIECLKKQKEEEKKILATLDEQKRIERDMEAKKERARESRLREERVLDRHMAREDRARRARMRDERARRLQNSEMFEEDGNNNNVQSGLTKVFDILRSHPDAWPFVEPVDDNVAPGYFTVIKQPMDLSTIEGKLKAHQYTQICEFEADITLMVDNCRKYNGVESDYTKMAERLGRAYSRAIQRYFHTPSTDSDDDEDVDVTENGDIDKMSALNRPRRQASMKAMQMLTQVAEEVLRDSRKSKRKVTHPSWTNSSDYTSSSSSSSGEDEITTPMMSIKERERNSSNQLAEVVNKTVNGVPGEKQNSVLNFTTLCKKPFAITSQITTSSMTLTTTTTTTTTPISTTKVLLVRETPVNSMPVKKRTAYVIPGDIKKCRVDGNPQVSTMVTNNQATVISLLKKPESKEVNNSVTPTQVANVQHVTTTPTQIQFVTSSGLRVAGLPSNLVPLTLRTTQVQTQPQMFFIHQQGGQMILEQQIVAPTFQVNTSQVATQFIPATSTHKTLVALAPSPMPTTSTTNGHAQY